MYPNLMARDGILIVGGTPPRDKDNLYYELEQEAHRNPKWRFFHWSCWDNPKLSFQMLRDEKDAYYNRGEGYLWEQEYEARYVFGGKDTVFSVFDENKHVLPFDVMLATIAKDRRHLDYFIISDPGNRVCHANLFIAYDRTNGYVWVLDELYETDIANTATTFIYPRLIEKANRLFPSSFYWIYDEAELWFPNEINAQFPDAPAMTPTAKALHDKEVGLGLIKACMVNGRYFQSELCINLKDELLSYRLDDKGRYVKKKDHAIDALRYFFDFVGYSYEMSPKKQLTLEKAEEEDGIRTRLESFDLNDTLMDEEDFRIWN